MSIDSIRKRNQISSVNCDGMQRENNPLDNTNMERKSVPTNAFYQSHLNKGRQHAKDHTNQKSQEKKRSAWTNHATPSSYEQSLGSRQTPHEQQNQQFVSENLIENQMLNFDKRHEELELNENAISSQLISHQSISNIDETSRKSCVHWGPNKTNPSHESSMSVQILNMLESIRLIYGEYSYVSGLKNLPTS